MAHLQAIERKSGTAYRLFWYVNNRQYSRYFPPGTPKTLVTALKKDIEKKVVFHKAGLERWRPEGIPKNLTLREFANIILEKRKKDVAPRTLRRNSDALKAFMDILGADHLVVDLDRRSIEYFKEKRIEAGISKTGINKDLQNIATCFNAAVQKGILEDSPFRKIPMFKLDKKFPDILSDVEMDKIEKYLDGKALLAFQILRYTGARRGEVCRQCGEKTGGLEWQHIDFNNDTIRLFGKDKEERAIDLEPELKEILLKHREHEGRIIPFVAETLSGYFKKAMRKAGIKKKSSVHILRHSYYTQKAKEGWSPYQMARHAGHSDIRTTMIYVHLSAQDLKKPAQSEISRRGKG